MKNKYLIFLSSYVILFSSSLVYPAKMVSDCFTQFRWCNNYAEYTFFNSDLSEKSNKEYVEDVRECVNEYGSCIDPPKY